MRSQTKKRPADAGLFTKMSRFTGNQLAFTRDIGFNEFPDMVSEGLDSDPFLANL